MPSDVRTELIDNSQDAPGYRGALAFVTIMLSTMIVVSGVFWGTAPETVPTHYNGSGRVEDWSSKSAFLVLLGLLGVLLPVLLALRWPWARIPRLLNVPHRRYWWLGGRRAALTDRVVTFMRLVAGLLCTLMTAVCLVSLRDSLAPGQYQASPHWLFPVLLGAFLTGTLLCVLKLIRDLRPPRVHAAGGN